MCEKRCVQVDFFKEMTLKLILEVLASDNYPEEESISDRRNCMNKVG